MVTSSVARHSERNYGIGMLKLWYTMVHVYKTHARREIQINITSNTSCFPKITGIFLFCGSEESYCQLFFYYVGIHAPEV